MEDALRTKPVTRRRPWTQKITPYDLEPRKGKTATRTAFRRLKAPHPAPVPNTGERDPYFPVLVQYNMVNYGAECSSKNKDG